MTLTHINSVRTLSPYPPTLSTFCNSYIFLKSFISICYKIMFLAITKYCQIFTLKMFYTQFSFEVLALQNIIDWNSIRFTFFGYVTSRIIYDRGFSGKAPGGWGFFSVFWVRLAKIKTSPPGAFRKFLGYNLFLLKVLLINDENRFLGGGVFFRFDLRLA